MKQFIMEMTSLFPQIWQNSLMVYDDVIVRMHEHNKWDKEKRAAKKLIKEKMSRNGLKYSIRHKKRTATVVGAKNKFCDGRAVFVIPSRVRTDYGKYDVVKIDNYAFCDSSSLSTIIISSGVENIGNGAFEDCYNLSKVMLPEGLEIIGSNAFNGCNKLQSVVIPDSVSHIAADAFDEGTILFGRSRYFIEFVQANSHRIFYVVIDGRKIYESNFNIHVYIKPNPALIEQAGYCV